MYQHYPANSFHHRDLSVGLLSSTFVTRSSNVAKFTNIDGNCLSVSNECSLNLQPFLDIPGDCSLSPSAADESDFNVTDHLNHNNDGDNEATSKVDIDDHLSFFADLLNGVKCVYPRHDESCQPDMLLRPNNPNDAEQHSSNPNTHEEHSLSHHHDGSSGGYSCISNNSWSQNPCFLTTRKHNDFINLQCSSGQVKNDQSRVSLSMNNQCDDSSAETKTDSMTDITHGSGDVECSSSDSLFRRESRSCNRSSKRVLEKNSEEYRRRRERNNVAVRKSREKAKQKSCDTEKRVLELERDNQFLRKCLEELRNQMIMLKTLFSKAGIQDEAFSEVHKKLRTLDPTQDFLKF